MRIRSLLPSGERQASCFWRGSRQTCGRWDSSLRGRAEAFMFFYPQATGTCHRDRNRMSPLLPPSPRQPWPARLRPQMRRRECWGARRSVCGPSSPFASPALSLVQRLGWSRRGGRRNGFLGSAYGDGQALSRLGLLAENRQGAPWAAVRGSLPHPRGASSPRGAPIIPRKMSAMGRGRGGSECSSAPRGAGARV